MLLILQAFSVQAQCFINQYSNYTVPELVDILGEEDAHVSYQVFKLTGLMLYALVEWQAYTRGKYC